MHNKNLFKKIVILLLTLMSCQVYAENIINCALGTDCTFNSYNDEIHIPTIDNVDYKCHISQKNNISANGKFPIINHIVGYPLPGGFGTEAIYLGGGNINEGNLYFPKRMISENGKLGFFVEKYTYGRVNKIADITINCVKLAD